MKKTLTASFLKWTALVSMTVDHIGIIFRPLLSPLLYQTLRSVGRLSFPLFGFLLAEGYRFTRDRKRYGFRILFLGLLIQIVYTAFTGSFFLNILLTFSLSFPLLCFFRRGTEKPAFQVAAVLYLLLLWVIQIQLPFLTKTDFCVCYGVCGVALPLFCSVSYEKKTRLLLFALILVLLSVQEGANQFFCLISLVPVALYGGEKGKYCPKWFFYLYYPLHLCLLEGVYLFFFTDFVQRYFTSG